MDSRAGAERARIKDSVDSYELNVSPPSSVEEGPTSPLVMAHIIECTGYLLTWCLPITTCGTETMVTNHAPYSLHKESCAKGTKPVLHSGQHSGKSYKNMQEVLVNVIEGLAYKEKSFRVECTFSSPRPWLQRKFHHNADITLDAESRQTDLFP